MARVDTVIGYGIYGISEESVLDGKINNFEPDTNMHAKVAATVKRAAAISLLGANNDNWAGASICAATMLGFPASPDAFEVSVEVDGSQIFGHKIQDAWTFFPGKNGLPGLMVPSDTLMVDGQEGTFIEKSAGSWAAEGVGPEMVLSLAGLGIKLRLDDETTGLPSLMSMNYQNDSDITLTSGVMLKFASNQYPGMWLGEDESVSALSEAAAILEKFDPAITSSIHQSIAKFTN